MKRKSMFHQFIILTSLFTVFWVAWANISSYLVNKEVKTLASEVYYLGSKSFFHTGDEFSGDTFKLRANELIENKFLAPYSLGIAVIDQNNKIIEKDCGRFGLKDEMVDISFLSQKERDSNKPIVKSIDSSGRSIVDRILPSKVMVYVDKIKSQENQKLGEVWWIFPLKYSDSLLALINITILFLGVLLISTSLFLSNFKNKKTATEPLPHTTPKN